MSSKLLPSSKIPRLSTPPASPRGGGQTQGAHKDSKTRKTISLSSPTQTSHEEHSRATTSMFGMPSPPVQSSKQPFSESRNVSDQYQLRPSPTIPAVRHCVELKQQKMQMKPTFPTCGSSVPAGKGIGEGDRQYVANPNNEAMISSIDDSATKEIDKMDKNMILELDIANSPEESRMEKRVYQVDSDHDEPKVEDAVFPPNARPPLTQIQNGSSLNKTFHQSLSDIAHKGNQPDEVNSSNREAFSFGGCRNAMLDVNRVIEKPLNCNDRLAVEILYESNSSRGAACTNSINLVPSNVERRVPTYSQIFRQTLDETTAELVQSQYYLSEQQGICAVAQEPEEKSDDKYTSKIQTTPRECLPTDCTFTGGTTFPIQIDGNSADESEEIEVFQLNSDMENEEMDMEADDISYKDLTDSFDAVRRNRAGRSRKTKTIFSMEVPLNTVRIERGPGENGDGRGVHSPQTMIKTEYVEKAENNPNQFPIKRKASLSSKRESDLSKNKLTQCTEREAPTQKAVTGITDNWSKRAMTNSSDKDFFNTEKTSKIGLSSIQSCMENQISKYEVLASKILVLKRDISKRGHFYSNTISLNNPTSSLYAFMIFSGNLTVSSDTGLLTPQTKTFVEIRAMKQTNRKNCGILVDDKIEVKVFPPSCIDGDKEKLITSYQYMSTECPTLIHTETIDRIMLWDGGDLNRRLDFFNSVKKEEELNNIKNQIHHCESVKSIKSSYSMTALLTVIRQQLVVTNSNMKTTFDELKKLQTIQYGTAFLFTVLIVLIFGRFLYSKWEVNSPVVKVAESMKEEVSLSETIMKRLHLS